MTDHFAAAEAALDLADTYSCDGAPASAAYCLTEAQVHATLALAAAQQAAGPVSATGDELAALRRIVAQHIHAEHPGLGPIARASIKDVCTWPLLQALRDAGISLDGEQPATAHRALWADDREPGAEDEPDRFIPGQRGTEAGHDDADADRG